MTGIKIGMIMVATLAIAVVVISGRALIAHGYEAHIGHPMFHFLALIAFCLGCIACGIAAVTLGAMLLVVFVRRRKGTNTAEPGH